MTSIYRTILLLIELLLAGCTPSHLYVGPSSGTIATLQAKATVYENRNGESLRENYRPSAIDGKILRSNWHSAEIDGQFHLHPGPHKILARASIRRGHFLNSTDKYYGVLNATLSEHRHYIVNGIPRFADNQLDIWIEDAETGAPASDFLTLELTSPVQQPNFVSYPIYVPTTNTGR